MPEVYSRQAQIEEILTALVYDSACNGAVVACGDGLPLAMVGQADMAMIAAVAASIKTLAQRAHEDLTEIVTRDDQGRQIVNRYFTVGSNALLLSVEMPAGAYYRRVTGGAIRKIKQVWAT